MVPIRWEGIVAISKGEVFQKKKVGRTGVRLTANRTAAECRRGGKEGGVVANLIIGPPGERFGMN